MNTIKMDYEVINGVINRPISSGHKFNVLLPNSNCEVQKVVYGNYTEVIDLLIIWVKKYFYQTKDLSGLLLRDSLKKTCATINTFLFEHIQYTYNDTRNVKTPACIWNTRQANCQGYSLFASTILTNLGINHFFRIVAYGPTQGHIYVVIPKNQNITKLSDSFRYDEDYYTIDGTFEGGYEPKFKTKVCEIFVDPSKIEEVKSSCMSRKFKSSASKIALFGVVFIGAVLLFSDNTETP